MIINTETMVSISDANQNFSKVTRIVDEKGSAVIMKNNVPRYLVIDFNSVDSNNNISDSELFSLSKKMIEKNREAYKELAK